jgi:hypothetical protein
MTEHFPPPILNYSTLASLHTPATSIPTHQLPFSPASPSCMSPLQLPPPSPLPPCTTLHQSSLHQALPLNDTHFCDKTNSEADCGPGFCSSHKNTAKFKMRSSHKNTANYDQDSSHKNTVPHRPCISCRRSLSPSSPISPRQWLSLSLTSPLQASPYPALAQSPTVSSPTVSFMPIPSPITIIITTSTHQLLFSSAAPPGMSLHRQSISPSPSPPCTFPPISITPRQSPSLMSPSNHLFPSTAISPNTPHHHQPHHQGEMTWRAA